MAIPASRESITIRGKNIADLVAAAARQWPDKAAVIGTGIGSTSGPQSVTWTELDQAVNRQARRFMVAGLAPRDRVAISLTNSPEFIIAFFAAVRAGGTAVPFAPQWGPQPSTDAELAGLLEHSGARILVSDKTHELPAEIQVLSPRTEAGAVEPVVPSAGGEDIAVLSYTSGTTGAPRGVMLSHRALLANLVQLSAVDSARMNVTDRVLLALPLFHAYGIGPGLLHVTEAGATIVLADQIEGAALATQCLDQQITVVLGAPIVYAHLLELPVDHLQRDLASVQRLVSGAAPLAPRVLSEIKERTGLDVFEGYGLTEAGPVVTSTLVSGRIKPGSVGQPLPGIELQLVEPDGSVDVELDPEDPDDTFVEEAGGTGLVAVRGENLFSGYWPNGIQGPDSDGWFRTGDVGYFDDDGDLYLVDRANDLIVVQGFTVYPHEIEDVIKEVPGVVDVAVIGITPEHSSEFSYPSPAHADGEIVKAVVVGSTEESLSAHHILQHCVGRLASYKVPAVVEFVESLPRSATGKLRRLWLRS